MLAQTSVPELKTAAAAGDIRSQVLLARAYEKGDGVAQNDESAANWYRTAAGKGDPEAQNSLGVLYRLGRGVEQDKAIAVEWYRTAAKQGYGPAMFNLGAAYYNGDGVGVSDEFAYAWFVLGARAGSKEAADGVRRVESDLPPSRIASAKFLLAQLVQEGTKVPRDSDFALEMYTSAAQSGDSDANFALGRMYAEGTGVSKDSALAIKFLSASSKYEALEYLAMMHLHGNPPDLKKVEQMLAQYPRSLPSVKWEMAEMFWNGNRVSQDHKRAVKLFQELTGWADSRALYMMAIANRDGLGTKKNLDTACMYFVLAVTAGSSEAGKDESSACNTGNTPKAKKKAAEWLGQHVGAYQDMQKRQQANSPSQ